MGTRTVVRKRDFLHERLLALASSNNGHNPVIRFVKIIDF